MKKFLNILLGILMAITVALLAYNLVLGDPLESASGDDSAVSMILMWTYFLFVFGIASAIFCALFGMIQNPAGIKGTIVSLALVLIVVGASYFISAGHNIQIVDLQTNGFFGQGETVLTETSILVTYVAFVAAFATAVVTEICSVFK